MAARTTPKTTFKKLKRAFLLPADGSLADGKLNGFGPLEKTSVPHKNTLAALIMYLSTGTPVAVFRSILGRDESSLFSRY